MALFIRVRFCFLSWSGFGWDILGILRRGASKTKRCCVQHTSCYPREYMSLFRTGQAVVTNRLSVGGSAAAPPLILYFHSQEHQVYVYPSRRKRSYLLCVHGVTSSFNGSIFERNRLLDRKMRSNLETHVAFLQICVPRTVVRRYCLTSVSAEA